MLCGLWDSQRHQERGQGPAGWAQSSGSSPSSTQGAQGPGKPRVAGVMLCCVTESSAPVPSHLPMVQGSPWRTQPGSQAGPTSQHPPLEAASDRLLRLREAAGIRSFLGIFKRKALLPEAAEVIQSSCTTCRCSCLPLAGAGPRPWRNTGHIPVVLPHPWCRSALGTPAAAFLPGTLQAHRSS